MSGRFAGTLVAVTGGRSGIGEACVRRFTDEGASVAVLDWTDPDLPVDVTDETAVDAWFAALPGAPAVLVNAAGTGTAGRVTDLSLAEWRRVIGVNLDGTFLCLRAAARQMIVAGTGGCIVNISSINERWPLTGFAAYCASKAGVKMLTEVAALELGPLGIRVNAIAPGPIDTPLTTPVRAIAGVDEAIDAQTPLPGGWARPDVIASVAAFLASDDASWVTGMSITVDGGQTLIGEPDFVKIAERGL